MLSAVGATGGFDMWGTLGQWGILGLACGALFVFAKGAIQREREQRDQAWQEVNRLNEFIRTELLPKQVETAVLYKQVSEALEEAVNILTEMKVRESVSREQRRATEGPPHG